MTAATTPRTTTALSSSDNVDGLLLSLPQSDLPIKSIHSSKGSFGSAAGIDNHISSSATTTTKKADLVLFQLPSLSNNNDKQFQQDFLHGNCHIVASNQSASLVAPLSSYKLVTIGTSNSLVVWKDDNAASKKSSKKSNSSDDDDDDSTTMSSPPAWKRPKTTTTCTTLLPVTSCRLIQPGGSGSSFLVGQPHSVEPSDVLQWFEQQRQRRQQQQTKKNSTTTTTASTTSMGVSTKTLANLFQASPVELQVALSQIANIVAVQQQQQPTEVEQLEQYWQLITDENVLLGQRALTEYVVEESATVVQDMNYYLRLDDVVKGVAERLVQLMWPDDDDDHHGDGDDVYSREDFALAIARKTAFLAQTNQSTRKYNARLIYLDPQKVRRQPVYACSGTIRKPILFPIQNRSHTHTHVPNKNNNNPLFFLLPPPIRIDRLLRAA